MGRPHPLRWPYAATVLIVIFACTSLVVVTTSEQDFDDDSSLDSFEDALGFHFGSARARSGAPLKQTPSKLSSNDTPALLVIDVQYCFMPGGAIPVANGFDIVPLINQMRHRYLWRTIVRIEFVILLAPI